MMPKQARRAFTVRLPEPLAEQIEALAARTPLTNRHRLLARAIELGLRLVAGELPGEAKALT